MDASFEIAALLPLPYRRAKSAAISKLADFCVHRVVLIVSRNEIHPHLEEMIVSSRKTASKGAF